jgi:alpha-1,3-fucosyltransferase
LPLYNNETLNFTCLNSDSNIKTILLWNNFKGDPIFTYGEGVREPFKLNKCPVTNCELSTDRSKLNKSDFVLFHMRSRISDFPPFRFDLQRWIYVVYESAQHCPMCAKLNGVFNLSATYKLDSDFTSIYLTDSTLKWGFNKNFNVNENFLSKKTKFSFTVISSCDASSRRLEYIEELKLYIDIDIYGKCSNDPNKTCINNSNVCDKKLLSSTYKFYFAFENSICKDYVTEKFFKILHYNIIPVVLGGADYSNYAPRSAYIDVLDFETPRDLAKYLIYLSKNHTAYNSYFKWKQWININNNNLFQAYICEMCIKLHLEKYTGIERKQLGDLNELMSMEKNCKGLKLTYIKKFEWLSLPQYLIMRYFES